MAYITRRFTLKRSKAYVSYFIIIIIIMRFISDNSP